MLFSNLKEIGIGKQICLFKNSLRFAVEIGTISKKLPCACVRKSRMRTWSTRSERAQQAFHLMDAAAPPWRDPGRSFECKGNL